MTEGTNSGRQEWTPSPASGTADRAGDPADQSASVLVVDSEDDTAARIGTRFDARSVSDKQTALAALDETTLDCVVVSDRLDTDVIDLVGRIRARNRTLPVVVLAFDGSESLASDAISAGVSEYLPVDSTPERERLNRIESLCAPNDGKRSEDGIRAAIEHAADAVVVTDRNGIIEYVNPAFEALSGYSKEEAIGQTPRILKSGEQGEHYYERMWETILDGEVWEETIVNERRSGERYIAHQTVAPVVDADEKIERFVGIQRDITRQRRLEEQLERSELTLSRLYDLTANSDGDLETRIETVLEMATRHLDYQVGYFTRIADGEQEIIAAAGDHDQIRAGKRDPLERTYCRKTIESDEPVILGDAGEEGWEDDPALEEFGLSCYAGARVLVDDEPYGTLCFGGEKPTEKLIVDAHRSTVQTLANWVGYEIERDQYSWKLERQNERLERFASAVSHDLRNPLEVAQSYLTLAREHELDADALEHVADAHERMEEIIDDTLTLAREGELVESPTTVSLHSLATDCWRHVDTGDATLDTVESTTIRADPDKLRHIFENLFRNAVEHGSTSPETLTVRVGPTENGFYVEDDGSGIDDERKSEVFDFGYTTDGGSGFGLAIVETIARAHGWSVRVTESDSGGARFEFDTDGQTERCFVC